MIVAKKMLSLMHTHIWGEENVLIRSTVATIIVAVRIRMNRPVKEIIEWELVTIIIVIYGI